MIYGCRIRAVSVLVSLVAAVLIYFQWSAVNEAGKRELDGPPSFMRQ